MVEIEMDESGEVDQLGQNLEANFNFYHFKKIFTLQGSGVTEKEDKVRVVRQITLSCRGGDLQEKETTGG